MFLVNFKKLSFQCHKGLNNNMCDKCVVVVHTLNLQSTPCFCPMDDENIVASKSRHSVFVLALGHTSNDVTAPHKDDIKSDLSHHRDEQPHLQNKTPRRASAQFTRTCIRFVNAHMTTKQRLQITPQKECSFMFCILNS